VKLAIELDVPDGAIDRPAQEELIRSVKEQAVLKFYAGDLISGAQAAQILGITRLQFLDLVRTSGVGIRVDLDEDDFQTLRSKREQNSSNSPH
jgi:hypothetical protein